jgi:hypothetical protein
MDDCYTLAEACLWCAVAGAESDQRMHKLEVLTGVTKRNTRVDELIAMSAADGTLSPTGTGTPTSVDSTPTAAQQASALFHQVRYPCHTVAVIMSCRHHHTVAHKM